MESEEAIMENENNSNVESESNTRVRDHQFFEENYLNDVETEVNRVTGVYNNVELPASFPDLLQNDNSPSEEVGVGILATEENQDATSINHANGSEWIESGEIPPEMITSDALTGESETPNETGPALNENNEQEQSPSTAFEGKSEVTMFTEEQVDDNLNQLPSSAENQLHNNALNENSICINQELMDVTEEESAELAGGEVDDAAAENIEDANKDYVVGDNDINDENTNELDYRVETDDSVVPRNNGIQNLVSDDIVTLVNEDSAANDQEFQVVEKLDNITDINACSSSDRPDFFQESDCSDTPAVHQHSDDTSQIQAVENSVEDDLDISGVTVGVQDTNLEFSNSEAELMHITEMPVITNVTSVEDSAIENTSNTLDVDEEHNIDEEQDLIAANTVTDLAEADGEKSGGVCESETMELDDSLNKQVGNYSLSGDSVGMEQTLNGTDHVDTAEDTSLSNIRIENVSTGAESSDRILADSFSPSNLSVDQQVVHNPDPENKVRPDSNETSNEAPAPFSDVNNDIVTSVNKGTDVVYKDTDVTPTENIDNSVNTDNAENGVSKTQEIESDDDVIEIHDIKKECNNADTSGTSNKADVSTDMKEELGTGEEVSGKGDEDVVILDDEGDVYPLQKEGNEPKISENGLGIQISSVSGQQHQLHANAESMEVSVSYLRLLCSKVG